MDLHLWIELAVFAVLIVFSGFFSSSETSLFSLGKLEIEQMRRDDNPRIGLIERMLSEPRRLIVTILIGNEFVNVAASAISAAVVIELFGADSKLINLLVMVPILLLFGEITPKTLAIRNNVAFATFQSRPIEIFAVLIQPLRWAVRLVSDGLTTLLVGKERARGSIVTEDMIRVLANEAVGEGVLDKNEAQYVDRVFNYGHRTVGDLKTPRSHIFFLPAQMPLREMMVELRKTRHTKVPIYDGSRDNVLGFLYARDLVGVDLNALEDNSGMLEGLLREPYLVSESKPAPELFRALRRRKLSVALTVDEYGGITGLITMEDLLECIFGDIPSPSEQAARVDYEKLPDGGLRIPGGLRVGHFNRLACAQLETRDHETIAGLLLRTYGELPPEGTEIILGDIRFEITEVQANRIGQVTATKIDASQGDEPAEGNPSTGAQTQVAEGGGEEAPVVGQSRDESQEPTKNP